MSDPLEIIKDFQVQYRINEGATSFKVNLATPLAPQSIRTGELFEFYIYDNTLDDSFVAVTGIVEDVDRDYQDNGRIYGVSGRDVGRLLFNQPFDFPCGETAQNYTIEQLLELIIKDTGITMGRGQTPLSHRVVFNRNENSIARFCGSFDTKNEAINQLFAQYRKLAGINRIRWYINYAGYFRWFETQTERGGKTYLFNDDDRITKFNIKEDAGSIINVISGIYGDESNNASITRTRPTSIIKYGRCVGKPIQEQNYTHEQMVAVLDRELDMKSVPIYTAKLELAGLYPYETGTQIMFPDDPYHSKIVFTVVDYTMQGEQGKPTTSINLTTDESSISITNELDVIETVAENLVNDSKIKVGVLTSIPNKGSDRGLVRIPTKNGYSVVNARNPGGLWG